MSVSANVMGPAAIFGSSLNACSDAGTVRPRIEAINCTAIMLSPITEAAFKSCFITKTIKNAIAAQLIPISRAV